MQYFISDTHFQHFNILDFERGDKFKTVEEHDNFIMSLIESKVKKEDTIYHLGDFVFGEPSEFLDRWKKLPCRKVLILGNHDKYEKLLPYFDEISRVPIFLARNILLSHEPERVSPYVLNVHGHLHYSYLDSPNHLNANIYMTNYKLLTFKEIESLAGKLPPKNDNFMFEWYNAQEHLQVFLTNKNETDKVLDENNKIDFEATKELLANKYDKKKLENGEEIEVKRIAKRKYEILYEDKQKQNYIGRWSELEKREIIEKCVAVELSSPSRITERWEKCWVNGKSIAKLFPQEKDTVKFVFYHIERFVE